MKTKKNHSRRQCDRVQRVIKLSPIATACTLLLFGSAVLAQDVTSGKEPEPFWQGWSRLQREYDRLLPA